MQNSLMSMYDKTMLRKRSVINTVNDELKNICQIEYSRHRCFNNFIVSIIAGLVAYSFFLKNQPSDIALLKPTKLPCSNFRTKVKKIPIPKKHNESSMNPVLSLTRLRIN
jgi:hypothetical protein